MPAGTRELVLIGIGAGDPGWVTQEAAAAIRRLDILFVVLKSDELDELVDIRRVIVDQHRTAPLRVVELRDPPRPWRSAPDYPAAVALWRAQRREQWSAAVAAELGPGQVGGFLVWGDPSLYESTLAIAQTIVADAANDGDASEGSGIGSRSGTDGDGVRPDEPERVRTPLGAAPIGLRVIPGISCVLALAARHQIPLNRQGKAVQISPARLLAEGMPADVDDVVCMLDGKQTFSLIDPAGIDIYWGAYLGTPDEILICGALSEVSEEILAVRAEAVRRKGWMFDTYLLRRR